MSTPLRYFQMDMPYHIYNRGNRKGNIFLGTTDYQRFLKKLKKYKEKFEIDLLCFCLMPNHFHLLLRQKKETAITKFMLSLCTSYSKYFNIKHDLVGRLFQERFRAKLVDTDEYLIHLSRYIHLNPISDNLENLDFSHSTPSASTPGVERSDFLAYPWSSYKEYRENITGLCEKDLIFGYFSKTKPQHSYLSFVENGIPKHETVFVSQFL